MRDMITPKQERAFDLYQKLVQAIRQQKILFLVLGRLLKDIRDGKLYLQLGEGGFKSWEEFISNPEISIGQSTARMYIAIYEEYVLRIGMTEQEVAELPVTRLQRLLPIVNKKDPNEARAIVEDMSVLGKRDFDIEVRKRKQLTPEPIVYQHKDTGKWCIEYRPDWIHTGEDGKLHIINLNERDKQWST